MTRLVILLVSALTALALPPEEMLLALQSPPASAPAGACVVSNYLAITRAFTPYGNTSNSTFYKSPAFTPASNDLLLVFASYTPADDTVTVTNTGTLQFPWTRAALTNFNTTTTTSNALACWYTKLSNGISPFSMNVVLLAAAGTGVNLNCLRISGSATNQDSGSNSIVQCFVVASNATANPRVSIIPDSLGRNAVVFAVGDDKSSTSDSTPGNWMIEEGETAYTDPTNGLTVCWQVNANGYTMVTNIATSRDWAGIALEIRAGTSNCPTAETITITNRYVNTASTSGGDGTTTNTAGATRAYASLREAVDALPDVVTNAWRIYCMGQPADVLNVTQTHWDQRTTNGGYIHILQATTDRHFGVYTNDRYRLEITNDSAIYNNGPGHVRVDGLQVRLATTGNSGASYDGIRLATANTGGGQASNYMVCANCLVQMTNISAGSDHLVGFANSQWAGGVTNGQLWLFNCLAYGGDKGYTVDNANSNIFFVNCTGVSNNYNFSDCLRLWNCLSAMPVVGDGFGFPSAVNYWSFNNASDESSAIGLNSRANVSFTFVNPAGRDFRLQSGDTGAKDFGFPDPAYGKFTNDVMGTTRTGAWSIGFHEP